MMISSLRQEQERITPLEATAWQPYLGIQIPLTPGHETAEQTGRLVPSVEDSIWQTSEAEDGVMTEAMSSVLSKSKRTMSYNPT